MHRNFGIASNHAAQKKIRPITRLILGVINQHMIKIFVSWSNKCISQAYWLRELPNSISSTWKSFYVHNRTCAPVRMISPSSCRSLSASSNISLLILCKYKRNFCLKSPHRNKWIRITFQNNLTPTYHISSFPVSLEQFIELERYFALLFDKRFEWLRSFGSLFACISAHTRHHYGEVNLSSSRVDCNLFQSFSL